MKRDCVCGKEIEAKCFAELTGGDLIVFGCQVKCGDCGRVNMLEKILDPTSKSAEELFQNKDDNYIG